MATSRRVFLTGLFGATATACLGQGVAPHKAAALPRGKPSGLPFTSTFTDVAAKAGLRAVTVYGESDRKEYIVETLGCGCAFLDFDNDGWLDIFLLSGTRLADAPAGASNRLYKNNRDGTFTDVTEQRRTPEDQAGPAVFAWATTTTMASTICSSPTGGRTSSTATTATELSRT